VCIDKHIQIDKFLFITLVVAIMMMIMAKYITCSALYLCKEIVSLCKLVPDVSVVGYFEVGCSFS
jgi:hypothetical protein